MSSKRKNTPTKLSKEELLPDHASPGGSTPGDLDLDTANDGYLCNLPANHSAPLSSQPGYPVNSLNSGNSVNSGNSGVVSNTSNHSNFSFTNNSGHTHDDHDTDDVTWRSSRDMHESVTSRDFPGPASGQRSVTATSGLVFPTQSLYGVADSFHQDHNGFSFPSTSYSPSLTKPVVPSLLPSNKRSMETVLRKLSSKTSEPALDSVAMDTEDAATSGEKTMDTVQAVLAGEATLSEKERQISEMINHLQNIKENLNKQKDQVNQFINYCLFNLTVTLCHCHI